MPTNFHTWIYRFSVWEKKVGKDGDSSDLQDLVQLPATKKISPSPKVGQPAGSQQGNPWGVSPMNFQQTIRQIQGIANQKP